MSPSRTLQPKPDFSGIGASAREAEEVPAATLSSFDQKLRETRELVNRLRQANERLTGELEALKRQLSSASESSSPAQVEPELQKFRREREEIRRRVTRLLRELEDVP